MTQTPPGVVAIYTDKDGAVIASASDFDQDTYGGFTLREGQQRRVRIALASEVVNAYCSKAVLDALDSLARRRLLEALCQAGGRVTIIPVGHQRDPA